jgi:transcriptional regulator with XRE-family HTH domain
MITKSTNNREVGKWLSKLREYKRLTRKQLADACGFSEETIRSYELGRRAPRKETIQKILQVLDIPGELRESHAAWFRGTPPPTIWEPWDKPLPRHPKEAPYTLILLWARGHWRDIAIAVLSLLLVVALIALFRRPSENTDPQPVAAPSSTSVPTQTATAAPSSTPAPKPAATIPPSTPVPHLSVRRVQQGSNADCIYVNIRGISTDGWKFSIDGSGLEGSFDSGGNGRLCGVGANRKLRNGFSFSIYDGHRSVVPGGPGIPAIGGDTFEGLWR